MAATIVIYNDGQRAAKTSKAFDCKIKKELMRDYELSFSLANTDAACRYVTEASTFEAGGQLFDVSEYEHSKGNDNIISITAEHVSRRLNDYMLPANYLYMGPISEIVQNILSTAVAEDGNHASDEFNVGACVDVLGEINPGNADKITAMAALQMLTSLSVEFDFDNFTINVPVNVGNGNTHNFKFGVDLANVKRTWNRDNGITYDIDAANVQRIPGYNGEPVALGDNANVEDGFAENTTHWRIIVYVKCLDDPTQDSFSLGVFILDSAKVTNSIAETAARAEKTATNYSNELNTKVDKVAGKGLSTNDYTDDDKTALEETLPQEVAGKVSLSIGQDFLSIPNAKTPASAADTGTKGDICWDDDYIYVCVATDTWKRSTLTTW